MAEAQYTMSDLRPFAVVERLPSTIDAPRLARNAAADLLASLHIGDGRADDLALVVSELVTNAVLHGADGRVELRLVATPSMIRVEVSDTGTDAFPWPKPGSHGRRHGLDLVTVFSDRCGVDRRPWTVTWCELDLDGATPR
jgi:two-component sensor histidine kinase